MNLNNRFVSFFYVMILNVLICTLPLCPQLDSALPKEGKNLKLLQSNVCQSKNDKKRLKEGVDYILHSFLALIRKQ